MKLNCNCTQKLHTFNQNNFHIFFSSSIIYNILNLWFHRWKSERGSCWNFVYTNEIILNKSWMRSEFRANSDRNSECYSKSKCKFIELNDNIIIFLYKLDIPLYQLGILTWCSYKVIQFKAFRFVFRKIMISKLCHCCSKQANMYCQ